MMTNLEDQLKRALGTPPPDPRARERALTRLEAHMAEARQVRSISRTHAIQLRVGVVTAALLVVIVGVVGTAGLQRPAVANELDHLADANVDWAATQGVPQVRIEQQYLKIGSAELVGGPSYTIVVHAIVSRTIDADGSPAESRRITRFEFASAEDREAWRTMGSPPTGVEVGQETTTPLDQIYNFDAISTDPEALLTALQDGSVTPGYEPTSEQLFSVIGSLLSQPELTAEQRATLYEVVGSVEGVELLGDIPDPIGRIGVGFSRVIGPRTQILIFDRATGQPLATEESAADDPSQILEWQAFNPPT